MIICGGRYYLAMCKIWPPKSGRTLGNSRRWFAGGGTAGITEKRMRDSIGPAGLIHICCSIIKMPSAEDWMKGGVLLLIAIANFFSRDPKFVSPPSVKNGP